MSENSRPKMEKPWAVYGWHGGSWGIGKVIYDFPSNIEILYYENEVISNSWDPKWVKKFKDPIKAMAYFLIHQQYRYSDNPYTKIGILERFIRNFPSERDNFKKCLPKRFAQSSPK